MTAMHTKILNARGAQGPIGRAQDSRARGHGLALSSPINWPCAKYFKLPRVLDPVVQSIVSLTISLRHKFVKQISAKVTNTLLFFVEKM